MSPEPRPALEDTQRAMRWLVAIEDHVYKGLRERYVTELTTIQHALDAQAGARGDERALSDALVKYGAEHPRAQIACAQWLSACLRLGWAKSDLDWLEILWWRHHDRLGRLAPRAGTTP